MSRTKTLTPGFEPGFGESKIAAFDVDPSAYQYIEIDQCDFISAKGPVDRFIERPKRPELTQSWETVLNQGVNWGMYISRAYEFHNSARSNDYNPPKYTEYEATLTSGHRFNYLEPDVRFIDLSLKGRTMSDPRTWVKGYAIDESEFALGWTLGIKRSTPSVQSAHLSYANGISKYHITTETSRLVLTESGYRVLTRADEEDSDAIRKLNYESITAVRSIEVEASSSDDPQIGATDELHDYCKRMERKANYIDLSYPGGIMKGNEIAAQLESHNAVVLQPVDFVAGLIRFLKSNGLVSKRVNDVSLPR